MRTKKQILLRTAFVLYCAMMLWLLFGRSQYDAMDDYWGRVGQNLNLIPFATVRLYENVLTTPHLAHLIPHAIINLGGNVVLFIPLGIFLPSVFPKLRHFHRVLGVTMLAICLVEILQLVLLVGSCDIDDLLLNTLGAAIGYGIYVFSRP